MATETTTEKTEKNDAPTARAAVNESTHGHLSGKQIRALQDRDAAVDKVTAVWDDLCENEPLAMETLIPAQLREALDDLTKASQNSGAATS